MHFILIPVTDVSKNIIKFLHLFFFDEIQRKGLNLAVKTK